MIYHFYFEYHCRVYRNPVANSEVSWNIYDMLRKHHPTVLKLIGDECPNEVTKDDLLIGMIGPRWAKTTKTDLLYPIMPWPGQSGYWYDQWLDDPGILAGFERAKKIIALCGTYQYDLTKSDPKLARWYPKLARVDQGIDRWMFPLIKRTFNPPGQRKFYYFGLNTAAKGDDLTREACRSLGYDVYMTSSGDDNPNVHPLGYVLNSDTTTWRMLAQQCDFVVHPARCDCSPMTVLEGMARGFIPIVTPAAAMPVEGPITTATDIKSVILALQTAQYMPTDELLHRQSLCLKAIDSYYNMSRFMSDIYTIIKDDII